MGVRLKLVTAIAALVFVLAQATAAAEPTIDGVWQQIDPDTGKVGAHVTFKQSGGLYQGFLSKLFPDPGDDPDPVCNKCPGAQKGQPILGLRFIDGMKRTGRDYDGGTILDPETGTLYSAEMQLSPDGNSLTVRGYVGVPLFGRSQVWKRVP